MKNKLNVGFITRAAIIGAIYAALTLLPFSSSLIQFRVSEALTVLPFFTPAAIPGLFVGCLIGNLLNGLPFYDILFGSLATLTAAFMTYKIKNMYLAPLPPVIVNALVVGPMVAFYVGVPFYMGMLYVGAGQLAVCYLLGLPLLMALRPYKNRLFGPVSK